RVEVDNGVDPPVSLEELKFSRVPWQRVEFSLRGRVRPTASMRLIFSAQDLPNNSVAEAGIDDVRVEAAADCLAPDVSVDSADIDDADPARGNANGRADPGETVALDLRLHNAGTAAAHGVEARIVSAPPGVTVLEERAEAGDI